MRQLLLCLLFFASLTVYSQVDKVAIDLPDYIIPNVGVVHTLKIEVVNNDEKCKQIFLRNDPALTGIDFSGSDFTNPIAILAEYGGTLSVDLDSWLPSPFSVWFKNLEPGSKFTFYFLSTGHIDTEHLMELIRVSKNDFSFNKHAMEDLGWNADEIIINLPAID